MGTELVSAAVRGMLYAICAGEDPMLPQDADTDQQIDPDASLKTGSREARRA